MTSKPHPQRCETCDHNVESEKRLGFKKCNISNYLLNSGTKIYEMTAICGCASHSSVHQQSEQEIREKVLDELLAIKQYDEIRFHQKHTLPLSWAEVKVHSVSKNGKRIGIEGVLPGHGCTTDMWIDSSDVRYVMRWIPTKELRRQQGGEQG